MLRTWREWEASGVSFQHFYFSEKFHAVTSIDFNYLALSLAFQMLQRLHENLFAELMELLIRVVVKQLEEGQHGVRHAVVHRPQVDDVRPLFQRQPVNLVRARVLAYRRRVPRAAQLGHQHLPRLPIETSAHFAVVEKFRIVVDVYHRLLPVLCVLKDELLPPQELLLPRLSVLLNSDGGKIL